MIDLKAVLGQEKLDAFMQSLVRGRYNALLGAGASMGGASRDGTPLPAAGGLAAELEEAFGLPEGGASGLRRLYAAARGQLTNDGRSLHEYLKDRFTNTSPPAWMKYFVQLPWSQIWTLNIDDCLERAYESWRHQARQSVYSISWTERHRTARTALDETLLVHFHGKASKAHRESEIIFDISAYVNAVTSQHRWHRVFGDSYPAEPFLIVGASLDSEIDLQVVLEEGRVTGSFDAPSLIVLKHISPLQAEEYGRYGLQPIEAPAESFFTAVVEMLPHYLMQLTHEEALASADTPPQVYTFLSQWHRLDVTPPGPTQDRRHDFYAGHHPEWRDVLLDLPIERNGHRTTSSRLTREVSSGENTQLSFSRAKPFPGRAPSCSR